MKGNGRSNAVSHNRVPTFSVTPGPGKARACSGWENTELALGDTAPWIPPPKQGREKGEQKVKQPTEASLVCKIGSRWQCRWYLVRRKLGGRP